MTHFTTKAGVELRTFKDLDDLFDNVTSDDVLELVNECARIYPEYIALREKAEAQRAYHRKHQAVKNKLVKVAKELLAPDELAAIARQAESKAFDVD